MEFWIYIMCSILIGMLLGFCLAYIGTHDLK